MKSQLSQLHRSSHRRRKTALLWALVLAFWASSLQSDARVPGEMEAPGTPGVVEYVFTYSEVSVTGPWQTAASAVRHTVLSRVRAAAGQLFGIWRPTQLPDGALFDRLAPDELVIVVAWPDEDSADKPEWLDAELRALEHVTSASTRLYEPTVLPTTTELRAGRGFYVHRFNKYEADDVERVIRLSVEAWKSFEPTFGAQVVGLFRQRPDVDGIAQMVRIVWYADYPAWLESRHAERAPDAFAKFRERLELQLDGAGIAADLVEP